MLGDFNGHIEFLRTQKLDQEGQIVLDIIDNYNLTLLNAGPNYTG